MPDIEIALVNAFVDGGVGGNPAGVVLEGDRFTPAQRQALAARAGLSETAFVCSSESADVRLDIYTPTRPIPHCGHATVGAFAQLLASGRLAEGERVNETVDGPRRIRLAEGRVFLEQVTPTLEALRPIDESRLLEALGLRGEDLLPGFHPQRALNGNGTLLVPLRDETTLARLAPDMGALSALSDALDVIGAYVFVPRPGQARQAVIRMFAPAFGIPEESATGMMAGPLGYWLSKVLGLPGTTFRLEQGRLMTPPSPSVLQVEVEPGRVWVGGEAQVARTLSVAL
ncbi:MAG TPA: PhzF family phenazine biosynthesis protein [Holophagaceae bacterium]|nr:PhzF family phenazine biosynthesis protein [Holophagaceae bacterium]